MLHFKKHRPKHGYVSEFGDFMNGFLKSHPEVVVDRYKGWRIFWEKKVDFDAMRRADDDAIPVAGYYYE